MPHHFIDRLEELKARLARMTAMVQQAVEQAVEAVFTHDPRIMREVIDGDARIDDEEVRIEKDAIDMLALFQPAASDLRLITTIVKANSDFERIADCAVNIAQHVQLLGGHDIHDPPADLRVMGGSIVSVLRDTIQAFNLGDENLAQRVLKGDDVVDALYHQIVQDMLTGMSGPEQANRNLSNILIAKNLERIADHCTNIAEDIVYVHSGRIIRHLHAGQ